MKMPKTPLMRDEPDGSTGIVRWARNIGAAGLALFLMIGLATNLREVLAHKIDLFPQSPSWPAFLDGKVTAGIASALSTARLPVFAARTQRGLAWETLADMGPRVRQGCPGWLFIADELRLHPHGMADMTIRADVLARIRDLLKARGIDLLVVTVPDKTRIETTHLCGLTRPGALVGRMRDWNALLARRGIDNVDLTPVLAAAARQGGRPVYLRTDTHWNETGAAAAAAAAADAVASRLQPEPPQEYRTRHEPVRYWPGDLLRLAGLDRWRAHRPLPAEQVTSSVFEEVEPAVAGTVAPDASDLFGDVQAPNVALIGTSFSNNSGFGGFLEQHLHARVGRFAKDGGDFSGAAHDYFVGSAFRENPPQLLVWEIPERVLQLPDTQASRELPGLLDGRLRPMEK